MIEVLSNHPIAWFVRPHPRPQASLRLFCFPYSGGSAQIFGPWGRCLPDTIELWAIQLPGRERRIMEQPFTQMRPLIDALGTAIKPYLDRPFAFFGHSMGALISFELARYLRRHDGLHPVHLISSGHRAPHIPDRDRPIHTLPDPEFIAELRRLNGTPEELLHHAELLHLMLPLLRADFAVCETYTYADDQPLDCPVSAYGGLHDRDVLREDLTAWSVQTRSTFALRMFPGDHFFLNTARPMLLQAIGREFAWWFNQADTAHRRATQGSQYTPARPI